MLGRQRIVRRPKAQNIKNGGFIVANPPAFDESGFRMPAMRQGIGAVRHPLPVHLFEDFVRRRANRLFNGAGPVEILAGEKHPGQ